jgi:hypothetical protein
MKEVNSSWASVQNEGNECVYLIITEAVIITTCLCVSQSQQAAWDTYKFPTTIFRIESYVIAAKVITAGFVLFWSVMIIAVGIEDAGNHVGLTKTAYTETDKLR